MQNNTFQSKEKKVRAIIIHKPCDPLTGRMAMKYNYVYNSPFHGVDRFLSFARKFPNAAYVNFYNKDTGQYLGRIYLQENIKQ